MNAITTRGFTLPHRHNPMAPGQEYVLFLSPAVPSPSTTSTVAGVFQLAAVHWGAYPIQNNKVGNFSNWVAQRTDRTTDDPATFTAQIRDLVGVSK